MMGIGNNTGRVADQTADFHRLFGSLDTFFDAKFAHKHVTSVCFRRQKEAIVCLKALVAEVQNQRSSLNSASRTSLLICSQEKREDGAPNWIAWDVNKGIHNAIPRIAVLVESSDLIELRKKVAFYLQCLNLVGQLFDEFGGELH